MTPQITRSAAFPLRSILVKGCVAELASLGLFLYAFRLGTAVRVLPKLSTFAPSSTIARCGILVGRRAESKK